jgi:phytoene dehydrogenase-like protein
VFCVPPTELAQLFADTSVATIFEPYCGAVSNDVVVYDVGLSERISSPYTYLYNVAERVFITDISYYDESCVPPGGQLMQAVGYLTAEQHKAGIADEKVAVIESVYDRHFPGWRDVLVAKRISKRATVQEMKHIDDQRPLPTKLYSLSNAYFAGDWCEGEGQLSELSFSSAYRVVDRILAHRSESELALASESIRRA